MLYDLLILGAGLTLLLVSAELFVRGASGLSLRLGISPLVVGLTVVAFGTSAPELVVNLVAVQKGIGTVAFGNVVGSNIANVGLILGCSALLRPLAVNLQLITREIPFMVGATAVTTLFAAWLAVPDPHHLLPRWCGAALLLLFVVLLVFTLKAARPEEVRELVTADSRAAPPRGSLLACSALLLAGLAGLIAGGHLSVAGSVALARGLGLSEAVIGITLLAVGTSLPELATSLVASARGHVDLAIGNVVGSNTFNLLLILGASAALGGVELPPGGVLDLVIALALAVVLLPFSITDRRRIVRGEGLLLLAAYLAFVVWKVLDGPR